MEGTGLQPVTVEARSQKVDAAAQAGDPTQARWWWLVAAIVVGAIIADSGVVSRGYPIASGGAIGSAGTQPAPGTGM
jgi:hypothetical protein